MHCQGRGRPRKHILSCVATLTSSQKMQLRRIGKVLRRKQLKLRRQRILKLAATNVCSKITRHNLSSIRDLKSIKITISGSEELKKNFARQLGKKTICHMHYLWEKRANGVFKDCKSFLQCRSNQIYLNNIKSRNMAPRTIIFEDLLRSKDDDSPIDVHMDQWVGVEVHLFGRESSIGEVGSTTSNVCDKLRSVVIDREREDIYPFFTKKRDKEEDRKWYFEENGGIVPSWMSRRSIARMNASSSICNDHIAALLASLPKARSHLDDHTKTPINISSTEEMGSHACTNEEGILLLDQSSIAIIPLEQSSASQASIINLYKDSSLDFDLEKQDSISILHRDAIQVCPTTPEKAQKKRRSYQDTMPNQNNNTNVCEQPTSKLPTGDANNFKEPNSQIHLMDSLSLNSVEIESSCNSTRVGGQDSNVAIVECTRSLVDSMPVPNKDYPLENISHAASIILDHVQESFQLLQSHEPSALDVVMDDGDKGMKEGGQVLLTDSLSPYFIDFESDYNSTKVGKQSSNVVAVECVRLLVESTPTPPIVDLCSSVPHIATLPINLIEENSQVFKTQVPTTSILVVDSNKRKVRRANSKLNEEFSGIAKIPKVRKKYKPRVAKIKQIEKCSASQLQNEINENAKDHCVSKYARTKGVCHDITKQGMHKERNNCVSRNPIKYSGTIEESGKLSYQEESLSLRLDEQASKSTTLVSLSETPPSVDNTYITRNVDEYVLNSHPLSSFNLGYDGISFDSLLCTSCGLKQSIVNEESLQGLIKQTNNLSTLANEDQMISNLFIERQKQFEALSVELSNKVISLFDLPSIEQSQSFYNSKIEELIEQSTSDVLQCFEEIALSKKYSQATNEYNISSLSDEWTAYHVGPIEMIALNSFNEEEMQFDTFFKEQQSIVHGDSFFHNLNVELNESFTSDTIDTWTRRSPSVEDHYGVPSDLICGIGKLDDESLMQPNPSPSSIHKSFMAQTTSLEERTMSSFYASTSTKVSDIMLSRLKKMIEENCQKDVLKSKNAEQDLDYVDVSSNCGQIDTPNLYLVQKSTKRCKGLGLLGDNCPEEEDLMQVRNTIICQMRSQFQNPDLGSSSLREIDGLLVEQNSKDLMNMRDEVLYQMRSQFQDPDPTFSIENDNMLVEENHEVENLMKMSDNDPLQMHSQFLNLDHNSSFFPKSTIASIQDTPEITKNSFNIDHLSFQSQDANPNSISIKENTTILLTEANDKNLEEKSHDILTSCNATLNLTSPHQKNTCLEKSPFHLMMFIQFIEYIRIILVNTSLETDPLELSYHIQSHNQFEEKKVEFEKLWPTLLHSIDSEQLQKLMNLAELDFSSIMELVQCQQVRREENDENQLLLEIIQCQQEKKQDDGVNKENHSIPCIEVIEDKQIEKINDQTEEDNLPWIDLDPSSKENNHLADVDPSSTNKESSHVTDIVPFVGNAIVAYDGSFLSLRKKKPRPKVNLDTETIKVWKLLMGKIDFVTENDPNNLDNELKWKEERLIMQKQANTFIQRMHLIQGDRSFSCWKGSIVDSVIGVFLTQNVSDVLSSSAYMCLRARFPLGQGRSQGLVQNKSPKGDLREILQSDNIQTNLESFQTFQEAHTSYFHNVSSDCTLEDQEEIFPSQVCYNGEDNTSNLESKQVNTLPFMWSENPCSLNLQQNDSSMFNTQSKQPPILCDTSMNVSIEPLELNVNANENFGALDLEIMQENISLQSQNENQEPLIMSDIGQGKNNFELNAHCIITQPECNLTKEVKVSNLGSQLSLSASLHLQKEKLIGLERARLEAVQVQARKSCKWNALAEKYNTKCQQVALDTTTSPHSEMTEDGVDWEAVRCANLEEIADAIKERGMNWKLAGRIKGFLERLQLEQGGINLEWLRSIPSDDAKEFLSSVHGLGLKSVECIRLLTLHHLAFPVDTNVGRICVRLGWVPLEPLPEELQLHVLELYPVQATIQKYLWPRLCTLDQQTLYELHYQLITFGKVFCTKSKPNCNACPMRLDCKHFASALASAKLALLPPEADSLGSRTPLALPPRSSSSVEGGEAILLTKSTQPSMNISQYCQPIIEEPMTPESEADMSEFDIEDYPFSIEEIPHKTMIELINHRFQDRQFEMQQLDNHSNCCCQFDFSTSFLEQDVGQEMNTVVKNFKETLAIPTQSIVESFEIGDSKSMILDYEDFEKDCIPTTRISTLFNDAPSREVVTLPLEVASLPIPKLKNIERLRTVHYVYELPDNHPLLEGMDVREVDDPCFYLLAIWSPGEVPKSIPNIHDNNEEIGFNLSNDEESIKATLLVPCRTAMKGNFPLNGTYFQVNEVFADHESSLQPILVPRILLWNLRRRYVYFGTSVTSILRGMTTEEIQACFW